MMNEKGVTKMSDNKSNINKKNIFNRVLGLFLAMLMFVNAVPLSVFAIGDITGDASTIASVGNSSVALYVNKENGGFYIKTLDGTRARKSDINKNLLFVNDEFDTSFTSVRIGGEDGEEYIYGREYGFLGLSGKFIQEPTVIDDNIISSVWEIDGIEIEQRLTLIKNAADDFFGNVIIEYNVKNAGNIARDVDIRIMLDTMLGESDGAPFEIGETVGGNAEDLVRYEREVELTGDQIPKMWKSFDSFIGPQVVSYGFTGDYVSSDTETPDKFIMAHWNNLAETMFDYKVNESTYFSSTANLYDTADSAVAMYWTDNTLQVGETKSFKTNYGVMVNTALSGDAAFGVTLLSERKLELTDDLAGYKDDGRFNVTVELDNTLVPDNILKNVDIKLIIEEEKEDEDEDKPAEEPALALDDSDGVDRSLTIGVTEVEPGKSLKLTWPLIAKPQEIASVKEIRVDIVSTETNKTLSSVRTHILLPGLYNNKPEMTVTKITPERLYAYDEKYITILGTGFENLVDKALWDMYLVDMTGNKILVDPNSIFVEPDAGVISAIVPSNYVALAEDGVTYEEKEFILGPYQIAMEVNPDLLDTASLRQEGEEQMILATDEPVNFAMTDDEPINLASGDDNKEGDSPKKNFVPKININFTEDPKDRNQRSSVLAILKSEDEEDFNSYYIQTFVTEAQFEKFREDIYDQEIENLYEDKKHDYTLMMYIEGNIIRTAEDAQKEIHRYTIDATSTPVIINDILSYSSTNAMLVEQSRNANDTQDIIVQMDGSLKNINENEITAYESFFSFRDGQLYSLSMEDLPADSNNYKRIELKFGNPTGGNIGNAFLTALSGMGLEINLGELRRQYPVNEDTVEHETPLNAIAFSGSLDLNFLSPGGASKSTKTVTQSGKVTTSKTEDSSSEAGSGVAAANDSTAINDQGIKADISNVLYGQINDEETGFIGVEVMVAFQMPNLLANITKENFTGANFMINTYDRSFSIESSIGLEPYVEDKKFSGKLAMIVNEHGAPIPDELSVFADLGPKFAIPIGSTPAQISQLGFGIKNLYDTFYNASGGLPPLTISARVGLVISKILEGVATLEVSFSQIVAGIPYLKVVAFEGLSFMEDTGLFDLGLVLQWSPEFKITLQGNANFFKVILAYIFIGAGQDYFEAILRGAVVMPANVPGLGGKVIANAELGADLQKVYGAVKVGGVDFSVQYYWGGETTGDYPGPNEASASPMIEMASTGGFTLPAVVKETDDKGFIFGGNVSLSSSTEDMRNMTNSVEYAMAGSDANLYGLSQQSSHVVAMNDANSEYVINISPTIKSAMLEFFNYTDENPDIRVFDPSGNEVMLVEMILDENNEVVNNETANFWYQKIEGEDQRAYFTIPVEKMASGNWTFKSNQQMDINVHDIAPIAKIEEASYTYSDVNETVTVNWDKTLPEGVVSIYLTEEKIEYEGFDFDSGESGEANAAGDMGHSMGEFDSTKGTAVIAIPESFKTGEYFVNVVYKLDALGVSSVFAKDGINEKFSYTNSAAPNNITNVAVKPVGNGYFEVIPTIEGDYDGILIEALDENGVRVETFEPVQFEKGEDIVIGGYYMSQSKGEYDKPKEDTDEEDEASTFAEGEVAEDEAAEDEASEFTKDDELTFTIEEDVYSGLPAGERYTIRASAYNYITVKDENELDVEVAITSMAKNSVLTELPNPSPPIITLNLPEVMTQDTTITFTTDEPVTADVFIDGDHFWTFIDLDNSFTVTPNVGDGAHTIEVRAYNENGDTAVVTDAFKRKHLPPELLVTTPVNGDYWANDKIEFSGFIEPGSNVEFLLDGVRADVDYAVGIGEAKVSIPIPADLAKEKVKLTVKATDEGGNVTTRDIDVYNPDAAKIIGIFVGGDEVESGVVKGSAGETSRVKVMARCESGLEYELNSNLIEWEMLNSGADVAQDGTVTFGEYGVAFAKASFEVASGFAYEDILLIDSGDGPHMEAQNIVYNAKVGSTLTVDLDTLFVEPYGLDMTYEADYGTVNESMWSFTPSETGIFEVTINAINSQNVGGKGTITVNVTSGSSTSVTENTTKVDEEDIQDMIKEAVLEGSNSIVIDAYKRFSTSNEIHIPVNAIESVRESQIQYIELRTAIGSIFVDVHGIQLLEGEETLIVTYERLKNHDIPGSLQLEIGDNSVYMLSAKVLNDGFFREITQFDKPMKISFPYALKPEQMPFTITMFRHSLSSLNLNLATGELIPEMLIQEKQNPKSTNIGGNLELGVLAAFTNEVGYFFAKDNYVEFNDVSKESWYFEFVTEMAAKGYVGGIGNDMFAPTRQITRAEFSAILSRMIKPDVEIENLSFTDVKASDWFYEDVMKLYAIGLVGGVGEGKFAPTAELSRQDMVVMMLRALEYMGTYTVTAEDANALGFADNLEISDYAKSSVGAAVKLGIINGKDNNMFDPKGTATRAEASKVFSFLMD